MNSQMSSTSLIDQDCRLLVSLLEVETLNYKRLLRLAWRQNSYMKRQDVDRLEFNAQQWARYLPPANESRLAREKFVQRVAADQGKSIPPSTLEDLLQGTCESTRCQVTDVLKELQATAVRLSRQNELNRELAKFCIELAQEEAAIFTKCVLNDPSGCYSDKAETTNRGPGGVLVRQA